MAINEMPVRREDLKLTARIVRYFQAMARLLALVAAMVLAFGVHAHHAGSGTTDSHHTAGPPVSVDHNHYGVACVF